MWSLLDKPKTLEVTRKLAKEFSEMSAPPHDRPLSERRLAVYERALKAGSFRPVSWAKCVCKETGEIYRVNGKHTSTMLSTIDPLPSFYVVLESYEADTLEDVARLYSTFDSKTQVRSASDINRCFAQSVPELKDLRARVINTAVTAISFSKWQNAYAAIPAADRAEAILDEVEFVIWLSNIIDCPDGKLLSRGPVAAAMFLSWKKSHKDSSEFWAAVRDATGATPDTPDRRLNKYLVSMSVAVGNGGSAPISRKAAPREFFVKCIHAWNAWRKGQPTDLKYHAAAKIPAMQ